MRLVTVLPRARAQISVNAPHINQVAKETPTAVSYTHLRAHETDS